MKLPSIRGRIGTWTYYLTAMSFRQIADHVKRVDDELHSSKKLSDMIQRSITSNFQSICEYILSQEQRFLGALVLAVYDGDPQWIAVEMDFGDDEYFNLGFLSLSGDEKIFPVDGQHRVEGIKAAILKKNDLENESIPVVLIGHRKDKEGMENSRRLFTTLNRHAKPVTMNDIIALDEDDIAAIVTRNLMELESEHQLFGDNSLSNNNESAIVRSKQKAIPDTNKSAFTSIITLYQCNREIAKRFYSFWKAKLKGTKEEKNFPESFEIFLKYRRPDDEFRAYSSKVNEFWNEMVNSLPVLKEYLAMKQPGAAAKFRSKSNGGELIFRPVGLLPFVQAVFDIIEKSKESVTIDQVISFFGKQDLSINKIPWKGIVWNSPDKSMIMGTQGITRKLLIYMFDRKLLTQVQLKDLREKYAGRTGYTGRITRALSEVDKIIVSAT